MTTASIAKSSSGAHAAAPAPAPAPPRDVSISIVKASQREHVISRLWPEFVKVRRERERNKGSKSGRKKGDGKKERAEK